MQHVVRRKEVERITGLSKSSIYAMMQRGDFPQSFKLGERAVGWSRSKIDQWLEERQGLGED